MKKALVALLASLFLTGTIARAQNLPDSSLAAGYGTLVPIEAQLDYSELDRSYLNDPDTVAPTTSPFTFSLPSSPVWHPDGKRIFFIDYHLDICWIPDTGGTPRVVCENIFLYPYNGKKYVLNEGINTLVGFSPDGSKLYFIRSVYSEGEIVLKFNDRGEWTGVEGNATFLPELACLDMNTGAVTAIAKDVFTAVLSRSGKYVTFRVNGTLDTTVMNLVTGEQWKFNNPWWSYITADDRYVLCSGWNDGPALARIPIQGGEKEAFLSFVGGDIDFPEIDTDSEGNYLLFTILQSGRYSTSISNLHSGKTYAVLPSSTAIRAGNARFSPDGSRFCYIQKTQREANIYIKDIALPNADDPVTIKESIPDFFSLTGNFPNPFNPSTTISFTLPSSGKVSLAIYSITGQRVRELVNGPLSAGGHSVLWDGRDDSGKPVSSGVYLSRLTMGNLTATGRMLLAK